MFLLSSVLGFWGGYGGAFLDLFLPNCLLEEQIAVGLVFWVFVFFFNKCGFVYF